MTIKLIVLKSGEDIVSDISEMMVGENENARPVGYYLDAPCVVKMANPTLLNENVGANQKKSGYEVSLFPWMPLSADNKIPVPMDWVVTMVEPTFKLKEMYIEDVVNYGKDNQSNSINKQSNLSE